MIPENENSHLRRRLAANCLFGLATTAAMGFVLFMTVVR